MEWFFAIENAFFDNKIFKININKESLIKNG